ncbi:MAG: YebC/PmpR family DNA-binding transcriptional regulator, partial [Bdellovibrionales bacterium]|nr:YebC/PmpR family DNA-binding transcriptional regulator [Bdellovibrionales bacterium]
GTTGSLDYLFNRRGVFSIVAPSGDIDEFELDLIDHGLEDIFEGEDGLLLYSTFENFGELQRALDSWNVEIKSAGVERYALNTVSLSADQDAEISELVEALEEDDDVLHVSHNASSD